MILDWIEPQKQLGPLWKAGTPIQSSTDVHFCSRTTHLCTILTFPRAVRQKTDRVQTSAANNSVLSLPQEVREPEAHVEVDLVRDEVLFSDIRAANSVEEGST